MPDTSDSTRTVFERTLGAHSQLDAAAAVEFAERAVLPLRVSTLDAHGYPHITSLWFLLEAGRFLCCTQRSAVVVRNLGRDARAGFELAVNTPPYRGLSGRADARIADRDPRRVLEALADRYLGDRDPGLRRWLLARVASEVVLELEPWRMTSWDFSSRMSATKPPAG